MSQLVRVIVLQGIFLFGTIVSVWAAGNFIDNKDGTITDTQASLMWQKSDDGTERVWDNAIAYCESLELAGYTDWVLPKIHMLENLIEPSFSPTINPLFSVNPSYYWSSSESHISIKSAKYVNFFYGNTYAFSKDNTYYSICVRDIAGSQKDLLKVSVEIETSSEKEPYEVRLTSHVTGGTRPYFYEWDFGDGDFSSRSNPDHIFQDTGEYEVDLTVSDNDGTVAIAKKIIQLPLVVEPPVVVSEKLKAVAPIQGYESATPDTDALVVEPQGEIVDGIENSVSMAETSTLSEDIVKGDMPGASEEDQLLAEEISFEAEFAGNVPEILVLGTNENTTPIVDKDSPQVIAQEGGIGTEKEIETGITRQADTEESNQDVFAVEAMDVVGEKTVLAEAALESQEEPAAIKDKGILTVYASKNSLPGQMASGGQGLLSYSFMNAMGGDADWNKDGKLTARELKGYLGLAIDNLSSGHQEAEVTLSDGDFSLCAVNGVTHILAIGVESYREDTLQPLSFAAKSAESIAQVLTEKCSSWKSLVLTGENSSRANIFRALVKMKQDVGGHDNFIFYFAGVSTAAEGNRNLLTYDTLPELREYTGILSSDMTSLLESIGAANIIILFEAGPYADQ